MGLNVFLLQRNYLIPEKLKQYKCVIFQFFYFLFRVENCWNPRPSILLAIIPAQLCNFFNLKGKKITYQFHKASNTDEYINGKLRHGVIFVVTIWGFVGVVAVVERKHCWAGVTTSASCYVVFFHDWFKKWEKFTQYCVKAPCREVCLFHLLVQKKFDHI